MSMAQYVAFEPQTEVLGAAVLSVTQGLGKVGAQALDKHGIKDLTADGWYLQQAWLDALKELAEDGLNLVSIGMEIPRTAVFPPEIDSIHSGLASIDVAYHNNHRNGEIGCYGYEKISENHVRMTCINPYPSDFDYGIIYAMAQRFSGGVRVLVERAKSPCRLKGDDRCIYEVTW
jgi:hypothetical protein